MSSRKIDMTGHRSGRLVVVSAAPNRHMPSGQSKRYWRCVCDCGNSSEVEGQTLREGRVQSCGCLKLERLRERGRDLTGARFGRLAVIRSAGTTPTSWVCACDCGAEKVIATVLLTRGDALSCGCLQALMSAHRRWQGDSVGYLGMHDRLRATRGVARQHPCVDCGATARDWSYDGADPHEKYERVNNSLLAFSTDPAHYAPRCSKCHRRYDVALRRKATA